MLTSLSWREWAGEVALYGQEGLSNLVHQHGRQYVLSSRRAIETNLHARFDVDCWKLGMIKHPEVATCLRGRLYDCVCKFDKAPPL